MNFRTVISGTMNAEFQESFLRSTLNIWDRMSLQWAHIGTHTLWQTLARNGHTIASESDFNDEAFSRMFGPALAGAKIKKILKPVGKIAPAAGSSRIRPAKRREAVWGGFPSILGHWNDEELLARRTAKLRGYGRGQSCGVGHGQKRSRLLTP